MKTLTSLLLIAWAGWLFNTPQANEQAADTAAGTQAAAAAPDDALLGYAAGVIGGPHDFSSDHEVVDACAACHIPHRYQRRLVTDANSTGTAAPANVELIMYRLEGQRTTFSVDRYTPGPASLVCLGCHDGTVASSTIGSSHAMLVGVRAGFDLSDGVGLRDHPIGVPYPTDRGEYRSPGYAEARGVVLPGGRIECTSCHNPHVATPGMLVMSNRRSALCLSCHMK